MTIIHDENHFRTFASSLEKAIEKCGETEEDSFLERQKNQVETLVKLEKEFRVTLIKHKWGKGVYRDFIKLICDEKRNILAARPFFRERQSVFTQKISKALKKRSHRALYKFHFNYQFILFTLSARKWFKNSKIVEIARKITDIRTELVTMNMPLAISRARIFWSRTPPSHLSYMDLIQISAEGLMSAVDKFCLPFSRVFRAVAIGRIVGNFIDSYSQTVLHFYPIDKRKIYRANKLIGRQANVVDFEKLAGEVNRDVDSAHKTTATEIADLMAAASTVSADAQDSNESVVSESVSGTNILSRYAAPEALQPDVMFERQNSLGALKTAFGKLSMFEQKILKMKGISLL